VQKLLIFICLLGLICGCPVTQRQDTAVSEIRVELQDPGGKYWLYVPSDCSDDRKWPLVVTLHGTHGWDSSRAQIREWKYLADQRGFIVAAPDLRSVQGILPVSEKLWFADLTHDENTILGVIEDVASKYPVDRDCILLTGFSAGGYPLYYTGLRHPEVFSMLVARNCNSSIELFERIQLSDAARAMPVVIFWGKDDLGEINRQSWQAVRWLSEHGLKNVERKKYSGGHLRRPETAYSYWARLLPAGYRR